MAKKISFFQLVQSVEEWLTHFTPGNAAEINFTEWFKTRGGPDTPPSGLPVNCNTQHCCRTVVRSQEMISTTSK